MFIETIRSDSIWGATIITIDIVVSIGVLRTLHPNLAEMRVGALAFGLRIGDYDFHARQ
jgi:hypothetical protein